MKLFTKYNRLTLIATISVFIIGSCTFYFVLKYILINEMDESLYNEKQEITSFYSSHHTLPDIINTNEQKTTYNVAIAAIPLKVYNTDVHYLRSDEWSRKMEFGIPSGGQTIKVTISKPLEETEDLLQIIIIVTICMIGLILLTGFLINRAVINRLWRPFHNTISKIRGYKVEEMQEITLEPTSIDEFNLLNRNIDEMIKRVQKDFQTLREFTSYAAHEMQTPLAVIRTRLDMIIQDEQLLKNNASQFADIENSVRKLSRLYQSLLLLTKLENHQFVLNEDVPITDLIRKKAEEYKELALAKGIKINVNVETLTITSHTYLADIIIGNLLSNAIRYNIPNGEIDITLYGDTLTISNTSELAEIKQENLFKRFYRHADVKEDGNGLGLAIVKRICDAAGCSISYHYADAKHFFTIVFSSI
ncbi:MAG: HAMP domain-containing histidine kinase [Taibaiella sp.]|nr:HAMP domain-containing histidine kinase [Taibaiella sp.]